MRRLSRRLGKYCQPSNGVLALGACLLALDHRWGAMTWGGLSLFAGVMLVREAAKRTEVRCAPGSSVSRCD
ncbi:hypothetical protein [Tautonia rosea]|uniref:hypothetical protein n=1 Tax=Tautonia rosea TaxID=2728037 RepID=UPI0014760252|nr:hypothetical protein [Tautonia rosea]